MSLCWFDKLGPWRGRAEFDLGLMSAFCEELGCVQDTVPSYHVAGTNGKGSASSAIAAILGHAGYRVGLNSSPHLQDVRERFLIDGQFITREKLARAAADVQRTAEKLGREPTFHEGATLVAFVAFQNLDRAVYEVGLGGRLDASNVLKSPEATVITSVAKDHQAILGDSIALIAREKAGIVKPGVPLVVGDVSDDAFGEIQKIANATGAPVYRFARDFRVSEEGAVYRYKSNVYDFTFSTGISGIVQRSNLACALTACAVSGIDIKTHSAGLKTLYWPGRLETLVFRNKNTLLDCAHNPEGLSYLIKEMDNRELKEVVFLFGVLRRPDLDEIVTLLGRLPHNLVLLTPPSERAVPAGRLKEMFAETGKEAVEFDSRYEEALEYAHSLPGKQLVLAGSIYLVGAIRKLLAPAARPVWVCEESQ